MGLAVDPAERFAVERRACARHFSPKVTRKGDVTVQVVNFAANPFRKLAGNLTKFAKFARSDW